MGSGGELGSQEPNSKTASPKEILDYFEELLCYAMSIGMTEKQYWYDDPKLINRYIRIEQIKQQKRNNELWLQGAYIYQAIGSLAPIFNPFSKEKHARPYLKEPIPLTQKEKDKRLEVRVEQFLNGLVGLKPKGEEPKPKRRKKSKGQG